MDSRQSTKRQFIAFLDYYKWHLFFALLVISCLVFILVNTTTSVSSDLVIGYIGSSYIKEQDFKDNKSEIQGLLNDATEDGKFESELYAYILNRPKEMIDLFAEMVETESYQIYIMPRDVFETAEDKSVFAALSPSWPHTDTLTDESGRIYASSVDGNSILVRFGISNTENLYIAAADFKNEQVSKFEKNGVNITNYIINNRKKYTTN